jgi:predicted nucleic acid-binding protein
VSSYLDTSALAKWYLNEARSEEFEAYLSSIPEPLVSSLTVVEMRCLLARHRRSGHFDLATEARVFAQFEDDIARGHLLSRPVENEQVLSASRLIERLQPIGLRTLDAIHLAIAGAVAAEELATADRVMAEAAAGLGFRVIRFD